MLPIRETRAQRPFVIEYPAVTEKIPDQGRKNFSSPDGNKTPCRRVYIKMEASGPSVPPTFEQLMLPHLDAAYNFARWLLRDPHDAEDAVQEACLRAYRAIGRFRGGDSRPWLLTIVRNVCYSHLRKNRREPEPAPFDDDTHGSTYDPAEANAVAWREIKSELLRQGLDRLPAEFREAIVLHELEGLSYREISDIADIPIGTVMSRLARARRKLQSELVALAAKNPSHEL
ncbi:MAG: polymerase, sigma-24 subunit, subfamily [Verrucomicrobia bacterium]|nr:polymerase, sigma-24 subunit, subfamily [Verrucomicrobiota bacterium]